MLTRPAYLCLFASFLVPSCSVFHKETAEEKATGERRLSAKSHSEYRALPDWKKQIFRDPVGITKLDPGTSNIRISLAEQRGILFAGNLVAIDFPVSTGKEGHRTPTGKFRVMEKDIDHRSNLYGTRVSGGRVIDNDASSRQSSPEGQFVGAPMPYFMRLTGSGVGLHVGVVPNYPASHGCIRVPKKVMPEIFMSSKTGTPVVIQQASLMSANGPEPVAGTSGPTRKAASPAMVSAVKKEEAPKRFSLFGRRKAEAPATPAVQTEKLPSEGKPTVEDYRSESKPKPKTAPAAPASPASEAKPKPEAKPEPTPATESAAPLPPV